MSGICGMIDLTSHERVNAPLVHQMADLLVHRGPDGAGFYESPNVVLGAVRLGIIDLRAGVQPLFNEDRSIALVFDGEIVNYRELRDQLKRRNHILSTEGDSEIIIHLYEEYGLNLFSHLRGMYAFALWDGNNERLVLAVDHVGMKPLYLYEGDGLLLFASEVKALFADPSIPRRVNVHSLDTYLSFGYMLDADTLFEGIRRLSPSHIYIVERDKAPYLQPFWQFPQTNTSIRPQPDGLIVNEARDLLAEAVHIHLRSDVPLGLLLDEDLNSAALLGLMAREIGSGLKTYSVSYKDDLSTGDGYLRRLTEHFRTDHHERIFSPDDWWSGLEKSIYSSDEPIANSSAVELLLLAGQTRGQVKTALMGLGGDELFGGYPAHHTIPQLLAGNRSRSLNAAPIQTDWGAERSQLNPARVRTNAASPADAAVRLQAIYNAVFSQDLRASLYNTDLRNHAPEIDDSFRGLIERSWRDNPYDTAQALVANTWLAGNGCLVVDKVTMAASLEARMPFFDPVLLKFAASIPPALRMRDNKYVLREAVRPFLPEFALERPKQLFISPVLSWLGGTLSERVREVLLNPNGFITEFFNRPALERLLKEHLWGRSDQVEIVFRLLVLELWGQRFIKPVHFSSQPSAFDHRQERAP